MKLVCTQENFKRAIGSTERVVGKQITLPILENILLETEQGMLKVSATNLEIGVIFKIGAKVERGGKITVPAKIISNFSANLPASETVFLETKDLVLKIKSGDYEAQIKGLGAQEFPIIPESEDNFLFMVSAGSLKNAAAKLLPCTAMDSTRPELTGVNIYFYDKEIRLAATDSFRLAETIVDIEKTENYNIFTSRVKSVIVPAQTMAEIARIPDEREKVKVTIAENQVFFQSGSAKIVSRLINGKYPEYKHIIPQKFATRAMLVKEDLARAVKIASVFASSKTGEIVFEVKGKRVAVMSQSAETGENRNELNAEVSGPDQTIVFNSRYILDGINSVNTNSLDLLINNSSSPAVIRMVDEETIKPIENFTYVIMPIKS